MRDVSKLVLILVSGIAARLLAMLPILHGPFGPVDEYYVDQMAAKSVLSFVNPYSVNYVVHGLPEIFAYFPLIPIYYAPFYLLGDIRYGSIFADVLAIFAIYWIAKVLEPRSATYAPLLYALLPVSIWLTSVSSTNIMVGTAFMLLSLALILKERYSAGGAMLGLAVSASQLVLLAVPLIIFYYWRRGKLAKIGLGLVVFTALVAPFFLISPKEFIYDTVIFQFSRPLQTNGYFGLYGLAYAAFGIRLGLLSRIAIFITCTLASLVLLRANLKLLIMLAGLILFIGAFVLPVNGFWNYFLPSIAIMCAVLPEIVSSYLSRSTRRSLDVPSQAVRTA